MDTNAQLEAHLEHLWDTDPEGLKAVQTWLAVHEEEGAPFLVTWCRARLFWLGGEREQALVLLQSLMQAADQPLRATLEAEGAWILAELGRLDEAFDLLPPWGVLPPEAWFRWAGAVQALGRRDATHNTWAVAARFQQVLEHLVQAGEAKGALSVAIWQAELALDRGAAGTARMALADAREAGADAGQLAVLETALQRQGHPVPPVSGEGLLAHLRGLEERDPEMELPWLQERLAQAPGDSETHLALVAALRALGRQREADAELWRLIQAHPGFRPAAYRLLDRLLAQGDDDGLQRLDALVAPRDPATAAWARARRAFDLGHWEAVGAAARDLLAVEEDPDAVDLWARAALAAGDTGTALRLRRERFEATSGEEPGAAWDLMTAASAHQDWATVRATAIHMGLPLTPGPDPVNEDWGECLIRFHEEGEPRDFQAQRTGPATARILEPAEPGRPQHVGDLIVLDATPLEEIPTDPEARRTFVCTYHPVHTLLPGGFGPSWLLDGAAPSLDTLIALRDALRGKGWAFWVASSDRYRVLDPTGAVEEGLPGVLILVAAPLEVSPAEVDGVLTGLVAHWPHRPCWLDLAEAAGADRAPHLEVVRAYGL